MCYLRKRRSGTSETPVPHGLRWPVGVCDVKSSAADMHPDSDQVTVDLDFGYAVTQERTSPSRSPSSRWAVSFRVGSGLSAGEERRRDAADPRDAREQAPRQWLLRDLGFRQRLGGRCDEKGVVVGTTEGAAGAP